MIRKLFIIPTPTNQRNTIDEAEIIDPSFVDGFEEDLTDGAVYIEPELGLLKAVLQLAIADLVSGDPKERYSARRFFLKPRYSNFRWICHSLKLRPSEIVDRLKSEKLL